MLPNKNLTKFYLEIELGFCQKGNETNSKFVKTNATWQTVKSLLARHQVNKLFTYSIVTL